jgi:hemolysin III
MLNAAETKQRLLREPVSTITHGIGVPLSVAALVTLIVLSKGNPWRLTAFCLYGATLITLYTASALYHGVNGSKQTTDVLRRFDYGAIYLLIAGTYTPVCLICLRGIIGWRIFYAQWILASLGILAAIFWPKAPDWLRVTLYLVMGWMIALVLPELRSAMSVQGVEWLFAGGIAYSLGTVVFATNKPHLWPGKFSAHDLWHIFVAAGSTCHFILMATCIARFAV